MTVMIQVKDDYMADTKYSDAWEHNVKAVQEHKEFYRLTYKPSEDQCFVEKCFPKKYFELRGVYEED